jgi:hypothetical protein
MKMQRVKQIVLMAALAAATVSCGDVVRDGRSPVYMVMESLLASRGAPTPGAYAGTLLSDVMGRVTLRMSPKDIGPQATATVPSPSPNNEITVRRYRVDFRRSDGRNTPGVDVPYGFDGAATGTIPSGGTLTLDFEIVRHIAKAEAPLVYLATNLNVISTIAEVTFYGRDQVGNEVQVSGNILINFANHGDPS